jgi:hypothetical protein
MEIRRVFHALCKGTQGKNTILLYLQAIKIKCFHQFLPPIMTPIIIIAGAFFPIIIFMLLAGDAVVGAAVGAALQHAAATAAGIKLSLHVDD